MISYQKRVLKNGLCVLVEQDQSTSLAAINILYKVGSRNESWEKTGFAHLFEHLMFGGSNNAPDFDTPLQLAGGENNAFTNNDYTNFYDILPVKNIETALWLEADRMANLEMSSESLSIQRNVVIEEFKEVCLNRPYGNSWHHLSALAYKHHPYKWPTIGKHLSHIVNASLDDVRKFYEMYYQPCNAILSISSPLDSSEAFKLVEKWFGHIDGKDAISPSIKKEPRQRKERYKMVRGQVPSPIFLLAFHMPGRTSKEYYACDLLSDIMSTGKSSRFYSQLIKGQKLMSQLECYLTGSYDPGLIIIEGRPMPGISLDECVDAIWKIIKSIQVNGIERHELEKVKNNVIASLVLSDLNVLNKAISMAYFEWLGDLENMNSQEDIYSNVSAQDIVSVACKYLVPSNTSRLNYFPIDYEPRC